jgi:hypothetical protein
MKQILFLIFIVIITVNSSFGQNQINTVPKTSSKGKNNITENCITMQNHAEMIKRDSTLKEKFEKIELQTQEWLQKNSRVRLSTHQVNNETKNSNKKMNDNLSVSSLCGYDNNYYTTISAPSTLNQIVSPATNCTYGGEYVTITGLIAGNIYRISTCGVNNFDTQISIYTSGGGTAVAHNDDWCGSQSEIIFNPLMSGNYDILIDEYNCISNSLCASLEVELIYTPRPVITIPVVVHVIYNGEPIGSGSNISTAQIQSQIDVLNEDFRRFNSNIYSTPAAFRGISDDALIEFCLAQRDEFGNPTNGIDRVDGGATVWTNSNFNSIVKPITIWNRDLYLNLWTWNGSGAYAQFPGGAANTDGVVVRFDNFGNIGNVVSPFDLGKTAVHEIGHWLDLRHIWGDASGCSTDDLVNDTPLQDMNTAFGTCPSFPSYTESCSGNYPGTMFYNQMDYSGDACLSMFTFGQTSRIDAALYNSRVSLLSSLGCVPSTVGINESVLKDFIQLFPNPSKGNFTIQINDKLKKAELKIVNSIGEVVLSKLLNENLEEVNISNLTDGIYIASITSSYGSINKKIVLTK